MWSISDQNTIMGCISVNHSVRAATIELLLRMLILAYSLWVSYRRGVHILLNIAIISISYADAQSTKPECGRDRRLEPGLNTSRVKDLHSSVCGHTSQWVFNGLTLTVASASYHRKNLCLKSKFLAATLLSLHLKKEENMYYLVINTNI